MGFVKGFDDDPWIIRLREIEAEEPAGHIPYGCTTIWKVDPRLVTAMKLSRATVVTMLGMPDSPSRLLHGISLVNGEPVASVLVWVADAAKIAEKTLHALIGLLPPDKKLPKRALTAVRALRKTEIRATTGNVATMDVPLSAIHLLASLPDVRHIELRS